MLRIALALGLLAGVVAPVEPARANDEPVIIVFDVSGSMNDSDSSGTVKLETAKKAMMELARGRDGLPMGLWTYPGGNVVDGCAAGSWVRGASPSDRPDSSEVSAQIGLLTAHGGTPTGPALRAVADSLKVDGYDKATIILVSDGMSNCGPSPCEVAKEVVASGFDLTVAAVAFDIEEGGQGELQCIAGATGGTYTEAEGAGELLDQLEALQPADLELAVSAPTRVQAGEFVHLTVSVRNPGSQPVSDASMLLTFDNQQLIPMVPAPHKRLPAIPAGGTVQQRWSVGTRSAHEGTAQWKVIVGSRTLGAVSQQGSVNVTNLPLTRADGGALLADRYGDVLVMGDSYSSGEGAKPYLPEDEGFVCHRSSVAYGRWIDPGANMMACSGAKTREMMGDRLKAGQPPQYYLLPTVGTPDAAFLTTGGNDILFEDIVTQCFVGDCAPSRGAYLARVDRLSGLADSYEKISRAINSPEHVAMRDGALAPLIVSPYPNPFWSSSRGHCNGNIGVDAVSDLITVFQGKGFDIRQSIGFSAREIRMSEELLQRLNGKIESEVKKAAQEGYPVYYADSVQNFAVGHSICEDDSYFVRLTSGEAAWRVPSDFITHARQEMFHPNEAGHRAWANALIAWSQRAEIKQLSQLPSQQPSTWLDGVVEALQLPVAASTVVIEPQLGEPGELGVYETSEVAVPVTTTGEVTVKLRGLMPGTTVRITVQSESQMLGSPTVGDDGTLEATVQLPVLAAGGHHLVLEAYDESYQLVGLRVPLHVDSGLPWWFVIVGGIAVVSLLAGATCLLGRRRVKVDADHPSGPEAEPSQG